MALNINKDESSLKLYQNQHSWGKNEIKIKEGVMIKVGALTFDVFSKINVGHIVPGHPTTPPPNPFIFIFKYLIASI